MDIPVQITDYIVHLNESNKKQSSIKICIHDLSSFFKWIEKNKPHFCNDKWLNLKRNDYLEYLAYLRVKKMSEANLKRISSHLNGMLRFYGLYSDIGPLRRDKSKYLILDPKDLISDSDVKTLLASILSKKGLTETQLQMHPYLRYRNLSIVTLMINYGLTLSEVHNLNIEDINFSQNKVEIHKENDKRIIEISSADKKTLYKYFTDIPILYRPREYTNEPFFLAFSPKKLVFWYDNYSNRPKRISKVGISRLIENEVERAGIEHARAIHFRNRCILKKVELGFSNQELIDYFGFKNRQALYRFKHYVDKQ